MMPQLVPYMTQCWLLFRGDLTIIDTDVVTCLFCIGWDGQLPPDINCVNWHEPL